jgi:hypothetical protein
MPDTNRVFDHLHGFTASLRRLKERVREAVAGELSRLVAQTVQDVLQAVLYPPPLVCPADDEMTWDDDFDHPPVTATHYPEPKPTRSWYEWLMTAGRLLLGCVARPVHPWWPAVVLAGAGIAVVSQTPLLLRVARR